MKKSVFFLMFGFIAGILGQMAGRKIFKVKIFTADWWKEGFMQRW